MEKTVKKHLILFGGILVLLMTLLFLVVFFITSGSVGDKALSGMKVVAKDRAQLVETYIQGCCDYLEGFSKTTEVRDVLENPLDTDCLKAVRNTTSRIASDMENLEGLYVAKWDTYVLAHNNPDSMNKTFRDRDSALELEDQIKKVGTAFCTGIVQAPVTKRMVIPIYAPVKNDKGEMIGFAGAAFDTAGLEECLSSLKGRGIEEVGYALINVKKNQYIFSEEENMVGAEVKDEGLKTGIVKAHTDPELGGYYSFTGENGITSCYYMANRDWAFVVTEENSEVYSDSVGFNPMLIVCFVIGMIFIYTAFATCLYGCLPKGEKQAEPQEEKSDTK